MLVRFPFVVRVRRQWHQNRFWRSTVDRAVGLPSRVLADCNFCKRHFPFYKCRGIAGWLFSFYRDFFWVWRQPPLDRRNSKLDNGLPIPWSSLFSAFTDHPLVGTIRQPSGLV